MGNRKGDLKSGINCCREHFSVVAVVGDITTYAFTTVRFFEKRGYKIKTTDRETGDVSH